MIFLSYAKEDSELAHRIFWILHRMRLNPWAYEFYPEYGELVPEIIRRRISECEYMIVLLTQNGNKSPWVHQEIGIAHAFGKYILPILDRGEKPKGFVELRQYIEHNPKELDETISRLIYRIRALLNPEIVEYKCPKCGHEFISSVTPQKLVADVINEGKILVTHCPSCKREVQINPKTFEILR